MGLLSRIFGAFRGLREGWRGGDDILEPVDPAEQEVHLTEALSTTFGGGAQVDQEGPQADRLFRNITQGKAPRDLDNEFRERVLRVAYSLYLAYPLAFRGMEIMRDFIVGEEIAFDAFDPIVREVLLKHWDDETNDWDWWVDDLVLELGLFGELFLPVFVAEETGEVQFGYIDPLMVKQIVMDPGNARKPHTIILKQRIKRSTEMGTPGHRPKTATETDRLRVIHEDPKTKRLVGDVFVFQVNKVTGATRGNSDLLSAIDWLDQHEQLLFTLVEMARVQMAHVWDMEVKGAKGKQLQRYREIFGTRPKAGTVRIHNERVTIKAIAPDIAAGDIEKLGRMLKRHVAAALGLPEHWLSESGQGKADAAEMGVPTTKRLRNRQKRIRKALTKIGRFVLDRFEIAQPEKAKLIENRTITATTPPIWPIDTQRITAGLLTGEQAFSSAQAAGAMSPSEHRRFFFFLLSQLDNGARALENSTVDFSPLDEINEETMAAGALAMGQGAAQRDQLEQRQLSQLPEPESGANT